MALLVFHQRPTSSVWHLCTNGELQVKCFCSYRMNSCDATARNMATAFLDCHEVVDLVDTRRINQHRICDTCYRAASFSVRSSGLMVRMNVAPLDDSVDFSRPMVIGPGGSLHQAEKSTIAAAKKLTKELAAEFEAEFTVFVPHTTCGPEKPKIVTKRHKIN